MHNINTKSSEYNLGKNKPEPCNYGAQSIGYCVDLIRDRFKFLVNQDPRELVEELGGKIIEDEDKRFMTVDTIIVNGKRDFDVIVDVDNGERRRRFSIAHEIGHYILHSKIGEKKIKLHRSLINSDIEIEANYFAACLLMPEKEFWSEMKNKNNIELAKIFGVSLQAVAYRRNYLLDNSNYSESKK